MATFILMAGGTGGHLFPAMALAQELNRRGHEVHLATDERVQSYGADFPARQVHIIPAATPSLRNPIKFFKAGLTILHGMARSFGMIRKVRPDGVVAFGGYPCFPPFLTASLMGVPGLLHEQNAVLGRANRALARFARLLAVQFAQTRGTEKFDLEVIVTGNPVRDRVMRVADVPYPAIDADSPLHLLIFGGSQGARAFSDIVPSAIVGLPSALKRRLVVTQQCRSEDLERVTAVYRGARINVSLSTFFSDLPELMSRAHLVIGRAGASTIAELGVIGRPAILVPLPGSLDQDQRANGSLMVAAGGGWMFEQATLSPHSLGNRLSELLGDPEQLAIAAAHARKLGHRDAVQRLAEATERLPGIKGAGNFKGAEKKKE